jgi:hypothetical protein
MRLVDGEILIATLDRPDFERARRAVDGFAEWATYEDFQCDRDGWVIGLASAGHSARFTPVSLDHFLSWSACAGVAPTAERLNEFVELVESFRRHPNPAFTARLSHESDGASKTADGRFYVPVDASAYWEWLDCLKNQPSDSLLNAYAGLFLEFWAERPRMPTFADEPLPSDHAVLEGRRA